MTTPTSPQALARALLLAAEPVLALVPCPTCGGEGGHYEPESRFSRWHLDPPCEIFVPCTDCGGAGEFLEEAEALTLCDLEERCDG